MTNYEKEIFIMAKNRSIKVVSQCGYNYKERQSHWKVSEAEKLKGVRFGRPSKDYPDDWDELVGKYESGEMTAIEVAEICNITTTFYRRRKNLKKDAENEI